MQVSIWNLINEISFSIAISKAHDTYICGENHKADLQIRLGWYKHEYPACVSEKDFHSWILHNYGPKAPRFCLDCCKEYRDKMLAIGKCNGKLKRARGGNEVV